MSHILFKKQSSLGYKLEAIFWKLWEQSFFRFLVVGGINTGLGYVVTLILRYGFFLNDPKWTIYPNIIDIDISNTIMFLILFPLSYTLQVKWSFRTIWRWHRLFLYPLSSIPNYLLQQGMIYLFEGIFQLPPFVTYAFAAILPIPIMYLIIRVLVTAKPSLPSS